MESEFINGLKCNVDNVTSKNKKISEISPNKEYGISLINKENASEIIDQIVEEPLRKACKDLRCKGIETIMSSANRNNLLKEGEKKLERDDVKGQEMYLDQPTYESAGKGYAWIMLNYNTLSDENKEELFEIEKTKDSKGINIGEKIVWFVKANPFMDIFNLGKSNEKKTSLDEKFEQSSFVLQYNFDRYPKKIVILRMPIDDRTTVIDVERYFEKLTGRLKQQPIAIKSPSIDRS